LCAAPKENVRATPIAPIASRLSASCKMSVSRSEAVLPSFVKPYSS